MRKKLALARRRALNRLVSDTLNLRELRERHLQRGLPVPAEVWKSLKTDGRPGARSLESALLRTKRDNRAEGQRLRGILRFERALWEKGIVHVAGVDEAGMSPLAGPVAAAAVIFRPGTRLPGVDDSKKLTAAQREELAGEIRATALAWSVAFVEPEAIDRVNIYWAGLLAMKRAVLGLSTTPEHLLLDARKIDLPLPQQGIVGGDAKSLSIAAASILAKTTRDAQMVELDRLHPGYGFAEHKGYPVRSHVAALARLGATDVHRRSFKPVRDVLGLGPLPPWPPRTAIPDDDACRTFAGAAP
jgi:ribonuclease HII